MGCWARHPHYLTDTMTNTPRHTRIWIHISTETPGSNTRDLEKTNMSCRILKALTANCKISLPFCSKDSSADLQRFMLDALWGSVIPQRASNSSLSYNHFFM